jgi:hypothetical protein
MVADNSGVLGVLRGEDDEENCSLYFGLAGMAVALHAVHAMFELLGGNAGIALGARSHHIAHGTLGIAYALAAVGAAAGRRDLIELALAGPSWRM